MKDLSSLHRYPNIQVIQLNGGGAILFSHPSIRLSQGAYWSVKSLGNLFFLQGQGKVRELMILHIVQTILSNAKLCNVFYVLISSYLICWLPACCLSFCL